MVRGPSVWSASRLSQQALQKVQDELAIERECRPMAEQERDEAVAIAKKPRSGYRRWLAILDGLKASQNPQAIGRHGRSMPATGVAQHAVTNPRSQFSTLHVMMLDHFDPSSATTRRYLPTK
jgi:hypothetical protein